MTNELTNPDYLFEVSWEVCNKVGGIYTVIATKSLYLKRLAVTTRRRPRLLKVRLQRLQLRLQLTQQPLAATQPPLAAIQLLQLSNFSR